MTLELPTDLQSQVEELARQRGTNAQEIVIEATRAGIGATNANVTGAAVSPLRAAIEKIKATPIRALGRLDAAADLEEARAGQDR